MKKLLLLLSFLASQLLAEQCTEQQYKPYFDKNSDRFIHAYNLVNDFSEVVIDKKSISYNKKDNKVIALIISQDFSDAEKGIVYIEREYDLNNNTMRMIRGTAYTCSGKMILEGPGSGRWLDITSGSGNEFELNRLKKYLNIK